MNLQIFLMTETRKGLSERNFTWIFLKSVVCPVHVTFFQSCIFRKVHLFVRSYFYYFILVVLPSFPKKILGTLVHGVPDRIYKQTIKHPDKGKLLNQSSSITFKHSDRCGLSISMALNKNIQPNFTFGNSELRLMDHGWCLLFKTLKTLDSVLFTTNLRLSILIQY